MDFNELIRVDSHLLNHSRLLHSMVCTNSGTLVCCPSCLRLHYLLTTTCFSPGGNPWSSELDTTLPAAHPVFWPSCIAGWWMSVSSSQGSSKIDLAASIVNFSGLCQEDEKAFTVWNSFPALFQLKLSSVLSLWQAVSGFHGLHGLVLSWTFQERALIHDTGSYMEGGLCSARTQWEPRLVVRDPVWSKGISLSPLPQQQRLRRQQGIAFSISRRLCLLRGWAVAMVTTWAGPQGSSPACLSVPQPPQGGRNWGNQRKPNHSKGVRCLPFWPTSLKKGLQEGARPQTTAMFGQGGSLCPLSGN